MKGVLSYFVAFLFSMSVAYAHDCESCASDCGDDDACLKACEAYGREHGCANKQ